MHMQPEDSYLSVYKKYYSASSMQWKDALIQSISNSNVDGCIFPAFAADDIQIGMVGSAGIGSICEMGKFYDELHSSANKAKFVFDENTSILDFGCGFGRLTRFYLKDTRCNNIFGADCTPEFIDICKETFANSNFPVENFCTIPTHPPYCFDDNSFDLISAYSVFTHLSEDCAANILHEFKRILKPGGLIVFTLRQRKYLEYCTTLSNAPLGSYKNTEYKAFGDFNSCIQRFSRGEYMFYPSGGGDYLSNTFYGEAVVPPSYVRTHWLKDFDLVETFDDMARCSQAFLALKVKK